MSRKYQWKKSMAGLMASAMVATTVLGSGFAALPMEVLAATTSKDVTSREKKNMAISQRAATQGMVLLKNENAVLPIAAKKKVALFGSGSVVTIVGGTGSGAVNQRAEETVSIYDGLKKVYDITTADYLEDYLEKFEEKKEGYYSGGSGWWTPASTIERSIEDDKAVNDKAKEADTAIFVIRRNSGEGADRKEKDDYNLTSVEKENLNYLKENFEHVVVLLNVGGVIDTADFAEDKDVEGILLMSQAGMKGGDALAQILTGEVTPSGKLTDTWAKKYSDYPSSDDFSGNDDNIETELYSDGIYVGYRYFDTFGVAPQYEFGYGLSYTNFDIQTKSVKADKDKVTVEVEVSNRGKASGKEVVQVYFSAPKGDLDVPYQELAAYGKTDELAPGKAQTLTLTFKTSEMSSYSEKDAAYEMTKGDYLIRVGNSSRNTHVAAKINLDDNVITEQLSNQKMGDNDFDSVDDKLSNRAKKAKSYSYDTEASEITAATSLSLKSSELKLIDGNNASKVDDEKVTTYISQSVSEKDIVLPGSGKYEEEIKKVELPKDIDDKKLIDVYNKDITMEQFVTNLTNEEMSNIVEGYSSSLSEGPIVGAQANSVQGAAGETTQKYYDSLGIANTVLSDGPAGIRITQEYKDSEGKTQYQFAVAFPIGTLLAQTWDEDVVREVGEAIGVEMAEFGVTVWLAPGMNIHRNPLCGRNFEYYSEDPFLSGTTGASITNGVQASPGVGVSIKHYVDNNQEDNRNAVDNHISERAMREIYLKGFEIAVKTSQPLTVMSSYNKTNGTWSSENYDILEDVLRSEWGFKGMVMTDWGGMHHVDEDLHAGNDLIMPGGNPQEVLSAVEDVAPSFSENGYVTKTVGYNWWTGTTTVTDNWNDFVVEKDGEATESVEFDAPAALAAGTVVDSKTEGFEELPEEMQKFIEEGSLTVKAVDNDTWVAEYKGDYTENTAYLGDLQKCTSRVLEMIMASSQFAKMNGFKAANYADTMKDYLKTVQAVDKAEVTDAAVSENKPAVSENKPATETTTTIVGSDGNTYVITTPTNLPFSGRKFKIGGKKGLKVTVSVNGVKYVVKSAKIKNSKAVGTVTFTIKSLDTKKDVSGNKIADKAAAKAASKTIKGTELSFNIVPVELTKDNITLKMKGDKIKKVMATLKDNNGKEKKYKLKSGTDYELVSDNKVLSFKGNYKGTVSVDQITKK
ncbi:MAG: glycoside hydrolase family 3 C-terminal domain-containing protein [Lachnospiraceae bacterium]|nr:glycoside hydrolase family 3 C-terminal domain-containing protein [Lachnospiraceae bacterium]